LYARESATAKVLGLTLAREARGITQQRRNFSVSPRRAEEAAAKYVV
jgi:hypothetical protein